MSTMPTRYYNAGIQMRVSGCKVKETCSRNGQKSYNPSTMKSRNWTLFTNHAAVFFHLLEHPDATIRRVADKLDLAERTVVGVLKDLRGGGYLLVRKEGRHNLYRANTEGPMKRPEHAGYSMREFFIHIQSELNRAHSAVQNQVHDESAPGSPP